MKRTDARRNVQSGSLRVTHQGDASSSCMIKPNGVTLQLTKYPDQICAFPSRGVNIARPSLDLTLLSPSGILTRLHTRSRLPPSIPLPHLRSSSPPLYRIPINPVTHLEHLTIRHRLIRIPIDDQVTRHEDDQTCDGSARRLGVDHGYPVLDLFEWEGLRSRRMINKGRMTRRKGQRTLIFSMMA